MSFSITEAQVKTFSGNVYHLSQQMSSKLISCITPEPTRAGRRHFLDRVGEVEDEEVTTRHGDTPFTPVPHSRRALDIRDYQMADLVDEYDKLRTIQETTNEYNISMRNKVGRRLDRQIYAAFDATVTTGEDESGSATLGSGQQIASGSLGLTVDKLREASEILNDNNVDENDRFLVCTPKGVKQLLEDTEVTSSDYSTLQALMSGSLDARAYMGFTIKMVSTSVLGIASAAATHTAFAWSRRSLKYMRPQEMFLRVDERSDKSYSTQVYLRHSFGVVRMEEESVVQIDYDPTATL